MAYHPEQYAQRRDKNEKGIVKAFRQQGCLVRFHSDRAQGIPDLTVQIPTQQGAVQVSVEVKTLYGQMRASQLAAINLGWVVYIIRSEAEAVRLVKAVQEQNEAELAFFRKTGGGKDRKNEQKPREKVEGDELFD